MSLAPEDRRLAAQLIESGAVAPDVLLEVMRLAESSGEPLSEHLVAEGFLSDEELARQKNAAKLRPSSEAPKELPEISKLLDRRLPDADDLPTQGVLPSLDPGRLPDHVEDSISDPWDSARTPIPRVPTPFAHTVAITGADEGQDATAKRFPAVDVRSVEVAISAEREPLRGPERYRPIVEIGRGGMGRILRALDTEIGREVALKVMLRGTRAPDNEVRRFWMEVQSTGQLEHPSIIPIHDVARLPTGELFYVMKLLSGRTLANVIAGLRAGDAATVAEFTRVKLLTVFQQIAFAVAFAHSRGVIHRDVKPANIMIGRYGESMLLDWGLAKLVSQVEQEPSGAPSSPPVSIDPRVSGADTASGTITGTPQYMSPEATEGRPDLLTDRCDVYGLGVILYEILTLEPAFADLGFMPTIMAVRAAQFDAPRVRAPDRGITIELEELCLAAMQREPARRPAARQLAEDIGRILEGTREREQAQRSPRARP